MRVLATIGVWWMALAGCGDDPARPGLDADADASDSGDAADVTNPDATDPGDAPDGSDATDAIADGDTGDPGDIVRPEPDGWLPALVTPADFAALSKDGEEVKYLARVVGQTPPAPLYEDCYFQDMHRFAWHIELLHNFPELATLPFEGYTAMVLDRATRVLWGGAVKPWPAAIHPRTKLAGVVAYSLYARAVPGSLTAADIVEVDATLERCIPFAADVLVFVPTDPFQRQVVTQGADVLEAGDVDVLMPEALRPNLIAEAYVAAESYGTLLVVPEGELVGDYGPRDIVIATAAPNDISIVAGLVTKDPQNVHSHVNLRLAEKHLPSASVPGIYQNALVTAYAGKLVHLVVKTGQVILEPATLEQAEAWWQSHRPTIPAPVADLTVTALDGYDTLRADGAIAYGVKAANLGELHAILPPENRVEGFGIPFSFYADFIATTPLGARITMMLADPRMVSDATFAAAELEALRDAIEDEPFPTALLAALTDRIRTVFGDAADTTPLRFRSSTNAEDLDVISGAGLYDSKRGCLADDLDDDTAGPSRCLSNDERAWLETELAARHAELAAHPERSWLPDLIDDLQGDLTKEKPVARAVRKVWASLWNERAFEERAYYGIDHTKVFMGIAVEPSFVLERANAVAVTNLPAPAGDATGRPVYRIVSQAGWLSVVRPEDPLAVAEVLTFRRDGDARTDTSVLVPSSLVPEGETVWTQPELDTIADLLFDIQDHFASAVYPDLDPLSLDLEIKRTSDDRIVVKQVRPYLGAGEPGAP